MKSSRKQPTQLIAVRIAVAVSLWWKEVALQGSRIIGNRSVHIEGEVRIAGWNPGETKERSRGLMLRARSRQAEQTLFAILLGSIRTRGSLRLVSLHLSPILYPPLCTLFLALLLAISFLMK